MQLGRRSVAALGAAVLVAGFLAGCGSGSQSGGSDTTITLQHGYTDVDHTVELFGECPNCCGSRS